MADLILLCAPAAAPMPSGPGTLPALLVDDVAGSVFLLTDCSTSKRTATALPALDQAGLCPFIATAKGGGLWIVVGGSDVTATAGGARHVFIPENGMLSGVARGGKFIAAINA